MAVLAPATVPYSRQSGHPAGWFIGRCLAAVLAEAGLRKEDIDGLAVSSLTLAPDGVVALSEHFGMSLAWLEELPMGGASGVVALRRASRAVQAGDAGIVACLAGDGYSKQGFAERVGAFSSWSRHSVFPYGAAGPNLVFGLMTRAYMERYGATREDFGRVCIAQRENAADNPVALFRSPLGMAEYLGARPVAEPLHLYDCVPPCAGAEGFLVTTVERAKALGRAYAEIAATGEYYNAFAGDPIQLRGGWATFRDRLYADAGDGPADMDFVQLYDDYPVVVLEQLEGLGFCDEGAGAEFVRATALTCRGGGLPLNTGGGQLSVGQAGFAGGYLGIVEALRQLLRRPLGQQVPEAKIGLVSGYGMINFDRGLCSSAAILRRADA